jgi:multicomponent Na+:H+ antiporter subunit B
MKSLISQAVVRLLLPLFLFFSFYMLFRGHNEPGGGFIGGLIGTIVFILHGMIYGPDVTRKLLPFDPIWFIFWGLFLVLLSGVISLLISGSFLTGVWTDFYLPFFGKPGTPILFDIGIYLLVMGVVLKIAYTMLDE